jgi:hypothetical protein
MWACADTCGPIRPLLQREGHTADVRVRSSAGLFAGLSDARCATRARALRRELIVRGVPLLAGICGRVFGFGDSGASSGPARFPRPNH